MNDKPRQLALSKLAQARTLRETVFPALGKPGSVHMLTEQEWHRLATPIISLLSECVQLDTTLSEAYLERGLTKYLTYQRAGFKDDVLTAWQLGGLQVHQWELAMSFFKGAEKRRLINDKLESGEISSKEVFNLMQLGLVASYYDEGNFSECSKLLTSLMESGTPTYAGGPSRVELQAWMAKLDQIAANTEVE